MNHVAFSFVAQFFLTLQTLDIETIEVFMTYVALFLSALVIFLAIDAPWLYFMMDYLYKPNIGHLLAPKANFVAALFFYVIYIVGILYFVVTPGIKNSATVASVFISGAILGIMAYATYDLTNHATLKDWPVLVTVADIIWGGIITGSVSAITFFIFKNRVL